MTAISFDEAKRSVDAVQAEIDRGLPPIGGTAGGRERSAVTEAARKIGVHRDTLRHRVAPGGPCEALYGLSVRWGAALEPAMNAEREKRKAARGELGFRPVLPGFEITSTSEQTDAEGDVQKTWVKQARERGEAFEMPAGHLIKGVSALVGADGRVIQSWVKTREDNDTLRLIEALHDVFAGYQGRAEIGPPPAAVNADTLTVYPIPDLHIGMYAWAPETGDDYDLAIAESVFLGSMKRLVAKSTPSKVAVILNLGDYFHSDTRSNRTEGSGHVLDVDSRYARVLQIGVRLLIQAIELALQKHERVIVRCLPGNHDYHSSLALTVALACFFHGADRVKVDDDPSKFWAMQFGKTLVTATHGDMARPQQMPGIVAARWPRMWGETEHRYCLTGHVHHKSKFVSELDGMICESFQTLAGKDFWAASMGYSAGRSLTAIEYHREEGECSRHTASIPAPANLQMREAA